MFNSTTFAFSYTCANDQNKASIILNPEMFSDDTNLLCSHSKTLFRAVNQELTHINEWFKANKLSLNTTKIKYTFFHKLGVNDYIPMQY